VAWEGSYVDVSRRRGLIAAGALAAALLLAFVIVNSSRPTLALGQVIEKIRSARDFSFRAEMRHQQQATSSTTLTRISEPDKSRTDWDSAGTGTIGIRNGNRMLLLNATKKLAIVGDFPAGTIGSERQALEELKSIVEKDARTLGEKEMDGVLAKGFEAVRNDRKFTLWANAKTGEPIRIECQPLKGAQSAVIPVQILFDFKFHETFPAELFSLDIPAGYLVTNCESIQEFPMDRMAAVLKEYAKRNGGNFPPKMDRDITAISKVLGLPENRQSLNDEQRRIESDLEGLQGFLLTRTAGLQYQYVPGGKLGEKDKMVFWYEEPSITGTFTPRIPNPNAIAPPKPKPVEQKYLALYGDLHTETVTKDRLPLAPAE
jgi:outer membrane lipoprotein-sorting protein